MAGILDGRSLGRFVPGLTYDVDENLALQMIALGGAKPDKSRSQAPVVTLESESDEPPFIGGVTVIQPDHEDDRPTPRKRRRKKR